MCTSFGEVLNLKVGARRLAGLLGSSVVSFERQIYDVPKCGKKWVERGPSGCHGNRCFCVFYEHMDEKN